MKKKQWFIEMVHADAIAGEISCQQKFFLTILEHEELSIREEPANNFPYPNQKVTHRHPNTQVEKTINKT